MRIVVALLFAAVSVTTLAQVQAGAPATTEALAKKAAEKKYVLRSGEVITCVVEKGCDKEMVNGQPVYTMAVDGLTVRAALGQEAKVSFADVTITNGTAADVMVKPEDFRVEVDDVKYKRLSYVDPAGNRHQFLESREERVGHGLPPPEYWTSAEHKEAKEARLAAQSSKVALLPMGPVAAGAAVSGRVYFERPNGTSDRSLILPFMAAILEFPFPKPPSKKDLKKKGKAAAAGEAAAVDAGKGQE